MLSACYLALALCIGFDAEHIPKRPTIVIRPTPTVSCRGSRGKCYDHQCSIRYGKRCKGYYSRGKRIFLGADELGSLPHEWVHHLLLHRGYNDKKHDHPAWTQCLPEAQCRWIVAPTG
jgi:hypothetical protein